MNNILFEDGVIKTMDIEVNENCGGVGYTFFSSFKLFKDRVAVINTKTEEYYSYSEYLKRCIRTALALKRLGFKEDDTLAICSNRENLNANIPIIAGQFLGMTTFSLDPHLNLHECLELIIQVRPKILFLINSAKEMILKAFQAANIDTTQFVIFGKEFDESFLIEQDDEQNFKPLFVSDLRKTCMIHFSSGSTGLPKPICLNHLYFITFMLKNNQYITKKQFANMEMGTVSLRYSNWYWVSSSFELVIYGATGGCRLLRDEFKPNEVWELINKYNVTNLMLTPLQCIELYESSKPHSLDISSLVDITTGGYVLHKDYVQGLRNLLPGVHVYQIYGMTECGETTKFDYLNPVDKQLMLKKPNSCGLPVSGLCYKVIDLDTGKRCGPNQPGELYLKGKQLFNGFYNKDASNSFDDEGYFRTGDLVSFDEDFCFYVLERIKVLLGWCDWLIYPYHIEKVLLQHPSVYNAVVIGIPHKKEGDRLLGVVILNKNGPKVTEKELVKYVDDRVEDHKRLREGIKFVTKFPQTVTGKINRIKLKEFVLNNMSTY